MSLIQQDDAHQTLRCIVCGQKKFIPYRVWIRPNEKLEAIEAFSGVHSLCAEWELKQAKIRFFSRPGKMKCS